MFLISKNKTWTQPFLAMFQLPQLILALSAPTFANMHGPQIDGHKAGLQSSRLST